MRIFVPKEIHPGENRAALVPGTVAKLVRLGAELEIEQGLGASLGCAESEYQGAGAKLSSDRHQSLAGADMVLRVRKPPSDEIDLLKEGCTHVSLLDPFS